MNSNCDTFIKEELLTAEEQLISRIPGADLDIVVKNEPISDEPFPAVTIKTETEPLVEAACLTETVSIKTEQPPEAILASGDSFVIYELETENQKTGKTTTPWTPQHKIIAQENQATRNAFKNTETFSKSHLNQNRSIDGASSIKAAAPPTPILLNDKLRKRRKIIISAKPADKRKRYNIAGTAPSSASLGKRHKTIASTMETSKTCRLLNSGNKKIINHFMKHKHQQKASPQYDDLSSSADGSISRNTEQSFGATYAKQIEQQTATTTTQTQPAAVPTILSPPAAVDSLNAPQQTKALPSVPELRVKCLCSLTGDTASDNSELRAFFEEMFVQTRGLSKTQQRIVKMSLLKDICHAEDAVDQGKCCSF